MEKDTITLGGNESELDLQKSNDSDLKLASADIVPEKEMVDMTNLALSDSAKYLATYDNPHDWVLDEKEASAAKVLFSTEEPKSSVVGTLGYAAGEMIGGVTELPSDLRQYSLSAFKAAQDAFRGRVFPSATETALDREYKALAKLNAQRDATREEQLANEVGHQNVLKYSTMIFDALRDMAAIAGISIASGGAATVPAFSAALARGAAKQTAKRYARMVAKETAKKAGDRAIVGSVFAQEAGQGATSKVRQYMEKTGDYDLEFYDPSRDFLIDTGVAALNAIIERGIGVERYLPSIVGKIIAKDSKLTGREQILLRGLEGGAGESAEETLQWLTSEVGEMVAGYREWGDFDLGALLDGIIGGGVIGGSAGSGLHYISRRAAIKQLQQRGIPNELAADIIDTIASNQIKNVMDNVSAFAELRTKDGPAYEKMKAGIKNALVMQGWNERMIDQTTGQPLDVDQYINTLVNNDFINRAVAEALSSGLSIDDWLDVAQFTAIDNVLYVRSLGTVEDIQKRIDAADAVIKRQLELKKTGAENAGLLRDTRSQKAVLQKLKLNKLLDDEIERVSIQEAKTPEIVKEIDTSTADATELGKASTASDFVAGLQNITDEEKTKRLGNAVLRRIFGQDKRGFEAVMTKPEYANVRTAINNSAAKIFDYIKAHRAYGVAKDLRDALKMLPSVNNDNFISTVTTPDLTGEDPTTKNAFLYNFVFNEATFTSAFIDAYLIRAEESINGQTKVRLGKKDLVGQAFRAMDALMQTQADVAGLQYTSIYNEDGSVADPNVAAVMASWQNLFVEVPEQPRLPQQFLEQFDLANENARLDEIYPAYDGETIEVDGKVRTVYNSEGQRINKSAEALQNFWRWFGDSKVVDEQGRPLVVYHGTSSKFDVFKIGEHGGTYGTGIYFGRKSTADNYGIYQMPVYLKIENPFIVEGNNYRELAPKANKAYQEYIKKDANVDEDWLIYDDDIINWYLKDQGFDGVVDSKYIAKGANEFVAFEPTQIKSVDNLGYYNAQDPRMLYQIGYASMRGEMVGDYLDANLFAHTGEGPNVHGWGNYFLADPKIDKKRYYEKFDREGPELKYDGKKIDAKWFEQMGITYPETRNIIKYRLQNLSITKKWVLDTLERELRSNEERFKASVDNAIARVKDSVGEEKARKIIADIEKMLSLKGGSFISLVVPLNPVAYPEVHKIQKKYFKDGKGLVKDGKLTEFTDDFIEVYGALYDAFGQEARETSFASALARDFSELQSEKKSLEAVKKLDFDKFTGRTGFLYKGEDFYDWLEGKIRKSEARHGAWVADLHRNGMRTMVYNAVRDAFVHDTTIDEQLNKIEDKYITPWIKIKPELKAFIEKKIDEEKSRFPNADAKAVKKFFIGFLESPDLEKWPSDGIVYQDWYKDEASQADKDLIDAITGIEDHGIESPKGEKDIIIGLVNGVRDATAQKRVFDGAKNALKNVKKEDFVFKPNASMYKTDKIPENAELLDFSKRLNKQPQKIQQAIRKLVAENLENIWWLPEILEVGFADNTTDIFPEYALSDLFDLDIDPKTNVSPKILSIADMMESDRYMGKPDAVRKRMIGLATDSAVASMLKHPDRQVTIDDIAREVDVLKKQGDVWGTGLNMTESEKQTNKDFDKIADWLKKGLYAYGRKGTEPANTISKWFDVSRVELRPTSAVDFFGRLQNWLYAHPATVETYKKDKSLNLTKDADASELTAKLLLKQGIRGNRYWGGTDKRGFVTFEPTPVTERLYQGRAINGMYDPELSTILIGKNFNGTTLPHEMAHYWLDTIFKVFKQAQAGKLNVRPEWMAQKREMFAMLSINENQTSLTRGQQEKFATMLEAYITGVGVTNEITRTFTDYLKWVPEKYRNLQQLSYIDENGKIQNVFLDAKAVEFFNRWYENPTLPSLPTSPERQRFINVTGDDDKTIKVSIKEMNDREKEWAQDAEEQVRTDQRLYNTLDENMPADIKPTADAQKVIIDGRGNFLKTAEEQQKKIITPDEDRKRRWFERKSRETEAQKAQEYIEKNHEHAYEIIFGDPELIPNNTGIDRATLINTYMAMNNITPDRPEWATLHTNIAINQSLAGTQLALSNDKSYKTYLDALREIEETLEMKAATNYAGSKVGALERFNADIQKFLDKELPAIFATEPDSKEREMALKAMFEKARTTFSGNTTGSFLTQMDFDYAKAQKAKTDAFVKWAIKQIKKDAGAKLNNEQQAHLLQISAKAQQALVDLDNPDAAKAVAGAQELRKWQLEKQKLMGVSPKKFSLFGDYAPRAMLASINTLVVANLPSTAINTLVTNLAKDGDLFGKNNVSENLIEKEIKRIKKIYGATSMNLAQMEKPTSPSLLHGEKYSASGQKWYDPYTILGREDNFFRVPTFVWTLARIASTDAKASGRSADEVFLEYIKLSDQSDAGKLARKQALAVANMAVFTQNGALARCLNHIRSELNYLSRVPFGLDPKGFGLGSLIAPFLTTGANIAEMGIRGAIAPITTTTNVLQSLRTHKPLDKMQKLALRMDWTYFVLSAVSMALLAALTSDDDEFYTDPYITGRKYDPNKPYDSINLGGVWLDLDFFGPFAIPMRTAAKAIQAWKNDNGVGSIGKGYAESAKMVLGDIPLAESIVNNQFNYAVKKPGGFASSYLYNQANKLVPAQLKTISRATSRGQDLAFEGDWMGPTMQRKFHRNYGFDGLELTSQDLVELFTIKLQLGPDTQQYLDNILWLQ